MLADLKRKLMLAVLCRHDDDSDGAGGGGRGGTNKSSDGDGGGRGESESDDGGSALERAERESATDNRADYGDGGNEVGLHDVLGTDGTTQDLANKLKETPAGFNPDGSPVARTDREVSEALANANVGYLDRAIQVGPIDAIAQGDMSSALSRAVEMGLSLANPMTGAAIAVGDAIVDGISTGKWGRAGSLAGGAIGARAGLDIASGFANSANGAIAAAIGGPLLGGAAGASLGRAIGNGQGSVAQNDYTSPEHDGFDGSQLAAQAPPRSATVAASATGADGMGSSFYDFLATYGAGAAKAKG